MKIFKKYEEIIRYLFIGGLTTVISLLVYYSLVFTILNPDISLELQIANIISWIASVIFAYFTNRSFVFKAKQKANFKEACEFGLSRISTLLIEMLLMYLFVTLLHFNDKVFKLLAQIVVIIVNYIFSKFLVFKRNR